MLWLGVPGLQWAPVCPSLLGSSLRKISLWPSLRLLSSEAGCGQRPLLFGLGLVGEERHLAVLSS